MPGEVSWAKCEAKAKRKIAPKPDKQAFEPAKKILKPLPSIIEFSNQANANLQAAIEQQIKARVRLHEAIVTKKQAAETRSKLAETERNQVRI